jgi:hypothetical protein
MDKHRHRTLGWGDPSPGWSPAAVVTTSAAGAIIVLGTGAAYLLTRASPEALAATSKVLLIIGLVGLLLMAMVVTVRLSWPGNDRGGGRGRGGDQPPESGPGPRLDDVDAEFFRIITEERLRDIRATRRTHTLGLPADGGHRRARERKPLTDDPHSSEGCGQSPVPARLKALYKSSPC